MRKSLLYQTHSCKSLVFFLIENPDILFVFDQTKKSYLPSPHPLLPFCVLFFNVDCTESGLVETPVGSPESVHEVVDLKPVPKSKQQIKTVAIQNMQVPFKVG